MKSIQLSYTRLSSLENQHWNTSFSQASQENSQLFKQLFIKFSLTQSQTYKHSMRIKLTTNKLQEAKVLESVYKIYGLVGWVYDISTFVRLFNAASIFIQIISSISNNSV